MGDAMEDRGVREAVVEEQPSTRDHYTFLTPPTRRNQRAWMYAGAIVLFAVAGLGFLLAIRGQPNMIQLQAMTTLPIILGIGLFVRGRMTASTPDEVRVDSDGLTARWLNRSGWQHWAWSDIAWAEVGQAAFGSKRVLKLLGNDHRVLARLADDIQQFDLLSKFVLDRVTQNPTAMTRVVRWRKLRRTGLGLMGCGIFALALAAVNIGFAWSENSAAKLMASQGVEGIGSVFRKFVAPDGITHRIEYRVVDANGSSYEHNVEIHRALWDSVKEGDTIPIKTVPGRPDVSELLAGEIKTDFGVGPVGFTLVCVAVSGLGIFFVSAGFLAWRGMEVKFDKETSWFKIERTSRPEVK